MKKTQKPAIPYRLGYEIRRLREKRGITRKNLAHQAGVPYESLSRLERGQITTHLERLEKIAEILRLREDEKVNLLLLNESRSKVGMKQDRDEVMKLIIEKLRNLPLGALKGMAILLLGLTSDEKAMP